MVSEVSLSEAQVMSLSQLTDSLQEAESKLEVAYEQKDYLMFNQLKKFILDVQEQINQILK